MKRYAVKFFVRKNDIIDTMTRYFLADSREDMMWRVHSEIGKIEEGGDKVIDTQVTCVEGGVQK